MIHDARLRGIAAASRKGRKRMFFQDEAANGFSNLEKEMYL